MEIKKEKFKYILLLATIMLSTACKKETAINSNTTFPVVEAYLMAGKLLTVKIYKQKGLTDTAKFGSPVKGLQLTVSNGSKTVELAESSAGNYTCADTTFLVTGKTYSLKFNYLNYAVSAQTVMPAKPVGFTTVHAGISIDNLTGRNTAIDTLDELSWSNPDSVNHVLVFNNLDGSSFGTGGFGNNQSPNFELNTNQKAGYFVTQRIFAYFGHYQVILFSVNKEYINLLTSNSSNSTSQTLTSQPTNVTNGLGIFTAMQADTLSLLVE